jgi:hypothetical protein
MMFHNELLLKVLIVLIITIFSFLSPPLLLSDDGKKQSDCIDKAVERIIELRSLPEKQYLLTLDNQIILLEDFYNICDFYFPQCVIFRKFYYWHSEVKVVVSEIETRIVKHKIRCYHNPLSIFCPGRYNLKNTHGDVSEFYDSDGVFMGIAVYMGDGEYCPLPHLGYKKYD